MSKRLNTLHLLRTGLIAWFSIFAFGGFKYLPGEQGSFLNDYHFINEEKQPADTVFIEDMKFIPETIRIKKGSMVVWTNKDLVPHCVTSSTGGKWSSPDIERNKSWKTKISENTDYFCALHPSMKGKIIAE